MGRRAVGQARPRRPQSRGRRASERGSQGHPPRPGAARRLLGIQRRQGQSLGPRLVAIVATALARNLPRTGHGPDRRLRRLGMARLPQLMGRERRVLSEAWIERMLAPCPLFPQYGYLFWLNTARRLYPSASERSFFARGAGGNLT